MIVSHMPIEKNVTSRLYTQYSRNYGSFSDVTIVSSDSNFKTRFSYGGSCQLFMIFTLKSLKNKFGMHQFAFYNIFTT